MKCVKGIAQYLEQHNKGYMIDRAGDITQDIRIVRNTFEGCGKDSVRYDMLVIVLLLL